jgi:allantoinase
MGRESEYRFDLVVLGAIVATDQVIQRGWVAVSEGRIAAMGQGTPPAAESLHDAGDDLVFPGFIDGQTHACSYGGYPGLASTTRAAAAGGITTIVDMPYDNPEPLNSLATLARKTAAIEAHAYGDVALYATVAPGQGTGELAGLREAGICALKVSSFESHPVRFPRIPNDELLNLLEASRDTDLPVGLHNEDQEIVRSRIAMLSQRGDTQPRWHSASRPLAAELAATAAFLELGAVTGAHVHIVHLSSASGYELVESYRARGVRATAELCIHYLHFDAARDIERLGARMKVNPPIRAGELDGLWQQFDAGRVAFVSSDHSSWPIDNKLTKSIFDAGAGMTGLETIVPSFYTDLERRGRNPVPVMREYLAELPAKFFGLWPRKGAIAVGSDADFTVLRRGSRAFDAARCHDDLNWSAYDGETFTASVVATFVRGRQVWDGAEIVGPPGHGRFVPRTGASILDQKPSATAAA